MDDLLILLPYPDFFQSAQALSTIHSKQTIQNISKVLSLYSSLESSVHQGTVANHSNPNVTYWKNSQSALKFYSNMLLYKNQLDSILPPFNVFLPVNFPHWLGDIDFHFSHKCYLLQSDFDYYWPLFQNDEFSAILKQSFQSVPLYWGMTKPPSLAP